MEIYYSIIIVFLGGCLGIFAQTAFKFTSLRKVMRKSGSDLFVKKYMDDEWPSTMTALLTVLIVCFCLREITNKYPVVLSIMRIASVAIGWFGNRALQKLMGAAEKNVMNFVDLKTSIADKALNGDNITEDDVSKLQQAEHTATK